MCNGRARFLCRLGFPSCVAWKAHLFSVVQKTNVDIFSIVSPYLLGNSVSNNTIAIIARDNCYYRLIIDHNLFLQRRTSSTD